MKRVSILVIIAGAAAGWWLPLFWLQTPASQKAPRIANPAGTRSAVLSLEQQVQKAGSAMAKLQAVVAGSLPHRALNTGETPDLGFEEAEELALALAGESLAAGVQDGVTFITSLRESELDYRVREAAVEAWAEAHPDKALEALILTAHERYGVFRGAQQKAAARDPARALALLKAAPASAAGAGIWEAVTEALAVKEPQTALEVVQAAPDEARRNFCMNALTEKLAEADPQQALAWRESLPEELKAWSPLSTIYQKWREKDPEAAMASASKLAPVHGPKTIDDFQEVYDMSEALAQAWIQQDAAAWYAWASKRGDIPGNLLRLAAPKLAAEDPVKALALYNSVAGEKQTEGGYGLWQIAREWSRQDPAAALTWARALPQGERVTVLGGMDAAIRTLPESERLALAREIGADTPLGFQLLYDVDREKALTAFTSAPPEMQRKQFSSVSSRLMETDPAAAASLFQSVLQQPAAETANDREFRPAVQAAEITVRWASLAPEAAAAWAAQLPPGEAGTAAVQNAVSTWARFDYPAANAWAAAQQAGPVRDVAMKRLEMLAESGGGPGHF